MLIVLNPAANSGGAPRRWENVETQLRQRYPHLAVELPADSEQAKKTVRTAIETGSPRVIAAAGGDGMVNLVLNALFDPATDQLLPGADQVAIGAIGLGSSNDFHKPVPTGARIAGVPVRTDPDRTELVDVGKATVVQPDGTRVVRYFLLNASMGLVAEGNRAFNQATGVLGWLKGLHVEAAIIATALATIATHRPLNLDVRAREWHYSGPATAIGVLKSVHFAGGMRYDTPVTRTDGSFDVNLWTSTRRARVLARIAGLYQGRFTGQPGTACHRASALDLRPDRPAPLELDGEIIMAESARLEVLPRAVRVCTA